MLTSDFDYFLPEELIAQEPLEDRSASRMLVLNRATGDVQHRMFRDFPEYLNPGDVLVINDTRVSAFRLRGHRPSGAQVEALFLESVGGSVYRALMKPGRRLRAGDEVIFSDDLTGRIIRRLEDGSRLVEMSGEDVGAAIASAAETPLPPYIRKPLTAGERYQTVYSKDEGSSAAPTAGLHFTDEVLDRLTRRGVEVARVTLHVGASTFRPVRSQTLDEHELAAERIRITREAAQTINAGAGRVVCVGTTSTRTVEACAAGPGRVSPRESETDLFIKPGYEFRVTGGLLTNFHMPRSTLFVLVSAFAGLDNLKQAYAQAVQERYRFLSLGDAMLIL
ncbi:MAG: tRNA preQ1(34) S-adenosylmethionine ribosyltransferase-isomerase QueA [Armatimonadetes bacterium]|nr:tRNA preQ1(34) S-adenosylmethionine ribosyltransferase-isomerase QueA [Armatimonadota bacterium]